MRHVAVVALGFLAFAGATVARTDVLRAEYPGGNGPSAQQPEVKEKQRPAGEQPRPVRKPPIVVPAPIAPDTTAQGPHTPACVWLGKRVLSLLIRDDAMGAQDFTPFYVRFGCSEAHLAKAFSCVVTNDGNANDTDVLAVRVNECWSNPDARFEVRKETADDKAKAPADSKEAPK